MSAENWSQERERLVRLLEAVEAGTVTHMDQDNLRQLQATNSDNVTAIKARLAQLNKRLGPGDGDLRFPLSATGGKLALAQAGIRAPRQARHSADWPRRASC